MNNQDELARLLEARKMIDKKIKDLKYSKRDFGSIIITKGDVGRNKYWAEIYRVRIKKFSDCVASEDNKYIAIAESNNLKFIYGHIFKIQQDINAALEYIDLLIKESEGSGPEDK